MRNIKIGLSMRITEAQGYAEQRDSISQEWASFFKKVFPDASWMYLPNLGEMEDYINKWGINSFILSGGDDIGKYPLRDKTELHLLDIASKQGFPTLGVCRGLQVMHRWLGGDVVPMNECDVKVHRAIRHNIIYNNAVEQVNSYHNCALSGNSPAEIIAVAEDGTIEGISYKNMLGIMWHPEREKKLPNWQIQLITNHFLNRGK